MDRIPVNRLRAGVMIRGTRYLIEPQKVRSSGLFCSGTCRRSQKSEKYFTLSSRSCPYEENMSKNTDLMVTSSRSVTCRFHKHVSKTCRNKSILSTRYFESVPQPHLKCLVQSHMHCSGACFSNMHQFYLNQCTFENP